MADRTRTRALVAVSATAVVIVIVLVVVLVVSRDAGGSGEAPSSDPPSARGATYSLDFRGAGAATEVTGLREFRIGDLSAPASVRDGVLSQGTTATAGATYFEREGRSPYRGIGVTSSPPDGPGDSASVLILTDGRIPQDARVAPRPNVLAHLVIQGNGWELGVWEKTSPTLQVVAVGQFAVAPGSLASYELEWTGQTVRVHQPDGTVKTATDKRFAAGVPQYATWELFQDGAGAESTRIQTWWAR